MIKLNLGSGIALQAGFINVDYMFTLEELKKGAGKKGDFFEQGSVPRGAKFVQANITKLPFPDEYADVVEAHQILEHLRFKEIIPALQEVLRVTKKGGVIRFSTPNFDNLCLQWVNMLGKPQHLMDWKSWMDQAECFYGYQANEGETHRNPITPYSLNNYLNLAGYAGCIAKVTIFLINSLVPVKGFGLIGATMRKYVQTHKKEKGHRVFRCETIYAEIEKGKGAGRDTGKRSPNKKQKVV